MFDLRKKKIFVAGHQGMVGAAIVRRLQKEKISNLITIEKVKLDLRRQDDVEKWMEQERPQVIFIAAAKVGGIKANAAYPANFLYDNLMISTNLIHTSHKYGVDKLLFLGSSCIYPKHANQPIKEADLLSGTLEPTNEAYAVAKIAGIKLCEFYKHQFGADFITAMPTNLYGPGDNFDPENSHVIPALIRRFHEAKYQNLPAVTIWGSGQPLREFLHVDDCADALVYLMSHYSDTKTINVGSGEEISIATLAKSIKDCVGYEGDIVFDTSKPDGTPRKFLDSSSIKKLGWRPNILLKKGLFESYTWFIKHILPTESIKSNKKEFYAA